MLCAAPRQSSYRPGDVAGSAGQARLPFTQRMSTCKPPCARSATAQADDAASANASKPGTHAQERNDASTAMRPYMRSGTPWSAGLGTDTDGCRPTGARLHRQRGADGLRRRGRHRAPWHAHDRHARVRRARRRNGRARELGRRRAARLRAHGGGQQGQLREHLLLVAPGVHLRACTAALRAGSE